MGDFFIERWLIGDGVNAIIFMYLLLCVLYSMHYNCIVCMWRAESRKVSKELLLELFLFHLPSYVQRILEITHWRRYKCYYFHVSVIISIVFYALYLYCVCLYLHSVCVKGWVTESIQRIDDGSISFSFTALCTVDFKDHSLAMV